MYIIFIYFFTFSVVLYKSYIDTYLKLVSIYPLILSLSILFYGLLILELFKTFVVYFKRLLNSVS